MLKHKVDDMIQVQTQEWMDAQEKDKNGRINGVGAYSITPEMQQYAGEVLIIDGVLSDGSYLLKGRGGRWEGWMFNPNYRPEDEPLSAEDAIRAMLNGAVLQKIGYKVEEKWDGKHFVFRVLGEEKWTNKPQGGEFEGLGRKSKVRSMNRWEILAWANSEESRGWLVQYVGFGSWGPPQYYNYADLPEQYQRALLLSDHSGIDEDTIQGFVVEE
jgi:hypothetical protein